MKEGCLFWIKSFIYEISSDYQLNLKTVYDKPLKETTVSPFWKRGKKEYFAKLNEKETADNRKFWYTVQHFLSDKVKPKETIILVNNDNK